MAIEATITANANTAGDEVPSPAVHIPPHEQY